MRTGHGPPACHYVTQAARQVPPDFAWLSLRERETLLGLRLAKRRADWLLGRWTAKRAVASRFPPPAAPTPLASIEILATEDGAPEVFFGAVRAAYSISISHRDARAVCALVDGGRDPALTIGCDLERIEPRDTTFVEDFFADEERALVQRCGAGVRECAVALVWSAKESALKLLRTGLRADTRSVVVTHVNFGRLDDWERFEIDCVEAGRTLPGWWRTLGDLVLTVVTAQPGAPPHGLVDAGAPVPWAEASGGPRRATPSGADLRPPEAGR